MQASRTIWLLLIVCELGFSGCQEGTPGGDSSDTGEHPVMDSPQSVPNTQEPPHPRMHLHAMLRQLSGAETLEFESELQQCVGVRGVVEAFGDHVGTDVDTVHCSPCIATDSCCGACACFHGDCSDEGACLCHADWFGDSCAFHALSHSYFLPRDNPSQARPWTRRRQAAEFVAHCTSFFDDLAKLQHREIQGSDGGTPEPADSPPEMLVVLMEGRGLGSWVHHMAGALTRAVTTNRTLVLHYPYDYFLHDGCPARSETEMEIEDGGCYFEPLVSGVPAAAMHLASNANGEKRLSDFWSDYLPPKSASKYRHGQGLMWWNVNLVKYIFSPNRRLQATLRRYKRLLGWPEAGVPVLGVHVRHGDACASWRKGVMHHSELMPKAFCLHFEQDVLPAIDIMVERYQLDHVFLSTDDPDVLAKLSSEGSGPPMASGRAVRWLGGGAVRGFLQSDTNYDIGMRLGVLDRRMTSESAILDTLLLAEADCFLGQLSGEFSRLALELSVANKGFIPPFISLDTYPWAPRYGLAPVPGWWERPPLSLEELIAISRNVSIEQVQSELYTDA